MKKIFNNLLIKFWEGKLPLWQSYWIVGEIINAIIIIIIFNIEIKFFNNFQFINNLPFLDFSNLNFINKFIYLSWSIFITIGIWRSAENYKGNIIWTILTLIVLSYRLFVFKNIFF